MKPQINFDATTVAGAVLDKLARKDWLINIKTGKPQPKDKANGKPITGFSPLNTDHGFYVRLNPGESLDHGLICVRSSSIDKATGRKGDGSKLAIGKMSDFFIGRDVKSRKIYRLDDISKQCADLYQHGEIKTEVDADASTGPTLDFCLSKYLGQRGAMLNDDDEVVPANGAPTLSKMVTMRANLMNLIGYSSDWRHVPLTEIAKGHFTSDGKQMTTAQVIEARADMIRDSQYTKQCPKCDGTEKCDFVLRARGGGIHPCNKGVIKFGTYKSARAWLASMATIHKAAAITVGTDNPFKAVLYNYPNRVDSQRAFTENEIGVVLNFHEVGTDRDGNQCKQKLLRLLAAQFALLVGFRPKDIVGLKQSDIHRHEGIFEIEQDKKKIKFDGINYINHTNSKRSRPHFLPMTEAMKELLDRAITVRDSHPAMAGSEFVFCSSTGDEYGDGSSAFNITRDRLVKLGKIKPEPVEDESKERLMCGHDCRRTFRGICRDDVGLSIDVVDALLDHGGSAMDKIYKLSTTKAKVKALARLMPDLEKYHARLQEIATSYRS